MPYKILLVGGGLQGIACARALRKVGHHVELLTTKDDYARKSTALSNYYLFDNDIDPSVLFNVLAAKHYDVVIPMSDKTTFFVAENSDLIYKQFGTRSAAPSLNVLDIAADKSKLMEFCKQNDLPHPLTIDLEQGIPDDFIWPALIKPKHSVGARGIRMVNNVDELRKVYPITKEKYGECQLQEYINNPGPYYNVMIYRSRGNKVLGYAILKIIRYYPINGGSSSMCQTIDDTNLLSICASVLEKLDYVGFADFDVLQTKSGDYKIIEINPRVPASLRAAIVSGVNIPAIIVADTMNETIPEQHYKPGKILRYLGLDIMWFMKSGNRFKCKPSWFKFFGENIYYQEGGWEDKEAMCAALTHNLAKIEFKGGKFRKKEE